MFTVEHIQVEIEALSRAEFVRLREWFAEKDLRQWDEQIEADSRAGKLDFLIDVAFDEEAQGELRDL
ncbi:MAG: hypothetical protein WD065_14410 [Planctomycetaceae bacterium]